MRTVAMCGHSVALSCVEASLQVQPEMKVVPADCLGATQPDVVVFELTTGLFDSLASFWKRQPGIPLIGLGLLEGGAVAIVGHASRVSTVEDLIQVIEGQGDRH